MSNRKRILVNFEEKESSLEQSEAESIQSDDSTFLFSRTIKNLLYVYGDQRNSGVNHLTQLILQELVSDIFAKPNMRALYHKCSKPWIEEKIDEDVIFPVSNSKNKKIMQQYLQAIFKEFVIPYYKLSKNLSKVEKCVSQDEGVYEKALIKKSQLENVSLQDEEHSQSISMDINDIQESPQVEWETYMKNRVEGMTRKEFIKFMELRSQTFISHKQFKKFIDPYSYGPTFLDLLNQKFLNYCLCRVLKRIIQKAMKESEGLTQRSFKLDEQTLKKHGYDIIQILILRGKKYALQDRKYQQLAYKLFQKEFISQGYGAFFQLKLKLHKSGQIAQADETNCQEEWQKMGGFRQRWIDRIKGEKQIRQIIVKNKQIIPNNPYTAFLLESLKGIKNFDEAKKRFPEIFKSWFLNYKIDTKPIDSIYD